MSSRELEGGVSLDRARRLEDLSKRFRNKSMEVMRKADLVWEEARSQIASGHASTGDKVRDAVLVHYGKQDRSQEEARTDFYKRILKQILPGMPIALVNKYRISVGTYEPESLELGISSDTEPFIEFQQDSLQATISLKCALMLEQTDMRVGFPNPHQVRPGLLNILKDGVVELTTGEKLGAFDSNKKSLLLIGRKSILLYPGLYGADAASNNYKGGLTYMLQAAEAAISKTR